MINACRLTLVAALVGSACVDTSESVDAGTSELAALGTTCPRASFKTSDNVHYLAAIEGAVRADAASASTQATFDVVPRPGGLIALRSATGKFVSAENGGGGDVTADRAVAAGWETFALETEGNGRVHVRAANGMYVTAENGGGGLVHADRGTAHAWETFTLVCSDETPTTRDPLKWPFASTSIWNMPIGSAARYVPAQIEQATYKAVYAEPDVIIFEPNEPLMDVRYNPAWHPGRCNIPAGSPVLFRAPIPASFIVGDEWQNFATAILAADRRTIYQTQPFAHCTSTSPASSKLHSRTVDIYGDGIWGAHGGSDMSSVGGTLRIGELRRGGPHVRHALKINLDGKANLFACGKTKKAADCYRWPAKHGDATAFASYGGSVYALRMGALLTLPASLDLATLGLRTEPAKELAWTLQNYGGYVVDNTGQSRWDFAVERGPAGKFVDQFLADWNIQFDDDDRTTDWAHDMSVIFLHLAVVDNNSPTTIGGGGTPRQPLAPAIAP
jgi:hypothetical protein